MSSNKEAWGTRVGLILAMAGNAVGLGNFLRFPMQAIQNGGGAFIIPYIVCFLLMGIPLLWIEWSIGRFGGRKNNHSTPFMFAEIGKKPFWKYFAVFGIFTNVAVAAYYCYIESWTLAYIYHSVVQTFNGMNQAQVAGFFHEYIDLSSSTTGIPYEGIVFFVACVSLNAYILSKGLKGGVEKAALIGMPLLILFGVFLAIRGVTLGSSGAPAGCQDCNAFLGLNYLWEPQFHSLTDPKVWLAAAGQIFFTLSVGMGTIQCYASYVKAKDDIALNAMSAGWMNSFVEVVLGASIVIPISVGYLGLDWVKENAGFNMAFQTMPYLFQQWGHILSTMSGIAWFGLLFFAGITSSLAFGTPWMSFLEDEFDWSGKAGAWSFGLIVLLTGLPTVFFYNQGVFSEYDYWGGTVSLVIFALAESLLFISWGRTTGWNELKQGADIRIPLTFKYIMRFITPLFILFVFLTSMFMPVNNDWYAAIRNLRVEKTWKLDANSIIGKIYDKGIVANRVYFTHHFESDIDGRVIQVISRPHKRTTVIVGDTLTWYHDSSGRLRKLGTGISKKTIPNAYDSLTALESYKLPAKAKILVRPGDIVHVKSKLADGVLFVNNIFYIDMAKILLSAVFIGIAFVVYRASRRRGLKY